MSVRKEKTKEDKKSFFKILMERRVPQVIGIYLAIGWGVLEFTDWLVSRFMLSPYLTDLTMVILISLAPSILMVAYFHGKPGKDRWNLIERIGIPVNLIMTVFLLLFIFSGKDLGSVERTVTIKNEKGEEIQRTIPKQHFKKNLALFYFDSDPRDADPHWLSYGITYMLEYDLSQDLFINTISPDAQGKNDLDYYFFNKIKEAGFNSAINIPLRLKQKIAKEFNKPCFLSGDIKVNDDTYTIITKLYDTKKGKLKAENQFTGENIFSLIDEISQQLKIDLDLPKSYIKEVNDLPLEEILTKSAKAARLYTMAQNTKIFDKDWQKAENYLEESITIDPTFAFASNELSLTYLLNNKTQKWKDSLNPQSLLMKHIYKLPERTQYLVRMLYYQSKQDVPKQIAIIDMLIQLNPEDLKAYSVRALFHILNNEKELAIEKYKKIMEIDHSRAELLQTIGELYESMGDFSNAKEYYQGYLNHFPDNSKSYLLIGNLNDLQGRFKEAKINFEKALVMEPASVSTLLKLGQTQINLGDYPGAFKYYQEALDLSNNPRLKAEVYDYIAGWYRKRGQIREAIKNIKLKNQQVDQFAVPILKLLSKMGHLNDYVTVGRKKEALDKIKEMEKQLNPPYNQWTVIGYISVYLEAGDFDKTKELLPKLELLIKTFGLQQIKIIIFSAKADLNEKTGQYQEAIDFYEKTLQLIPTAMELQRSIGYCYRKLGKMKKAKEFLDIALKYKPFNPYANFEVAQYYFDIKNISEGQKYLKIALDIWKDADLDFAPAIKAKELLK